MKRILITTLIIAACAGGYFFLTQKKAQLDSANASPPAARDNATVFP